MLQFGEHCNPSKKSSSPFWIVIHKIGGNRKILLCSTLLVCGFCWQKRQKSFITKRQNEPWFHSLVSFKIIGVWSWPLFIVTFNIFLNSRRVAILLLLPSAATLLFVPSAVSVDDTDSGWGGSSSWAEHGGVSKTFGSQPSLRDFA